MKEQTDNDLAEFIFLLKRHPEKRSQLAQLLSEQAETISTRVKQITQD